MCLTVSVSVCLLKMKEQYSRNTSWIRHEYRTMSLFLLHLMTLVQSKMLNLV